MGAGLPPKGGVLLPFIAAKLELEPEMEGRGGDPLGGGGDLPKTELRVEEDLFRGISIGASVVAPS